MEAATPRDAPPHHHTFGRPPQQGPQSVVGSVYLLLKVFAGVEALFPPPHVFFLVAKCSHVLVGLRFSATRLVALAPVSV